MIPAAGIGGNRCPAAVRPAPAPRRRPLRRHCRHKSRAVSRGEQLCRMGDQLAIGDGAGRADSESGRADLGFERHDVERHLQRHRPRSAVGELAEGFVDALAGLARMVDARTPIWSAREDRELVGTSCNSEPRPIRLDGSAADAQDRRVGGIGGGERGGGVEHAGAGRPRHRRRLARSPGSSRTPYRRRPAHGGDGSSGLPRWVGMQCRRTSRVLDCRRRTIACRHAPDREAIRMIHPAMSRPPPIWRFAMPGRAARFGRLCRGARPRRAQHPAGSHRLCTNGACPVHQRPDPVQPDRPRFRPVARGAGPARDLCDGLTKWAARIDHPSETGKRVNEAFRPARRRPTAAVALEMPLDTCALETEVALPDPESGSASARPPMARPEFAIAAKLLAAAKQPLIYVRQWRRRGRAPRCWRGRRLQAPLLHLYRRQGHHQRTPLSGAESARRHELWRGADVVLAVGTRSTSRRRAGASMARSRSSASTSIRSRSPGSPARRSASSPMPGSARRARQ